MGFVGADLSPVASLELAHGDHPGAPDELRTALRVDGVHTGRDRARNDDNHEKRRTCGDEHDRGGQARGARREHQVIPGGKR